MNLKIIKIFFFHCTSSKTYSNNHRFDVYDMYTCINIQSYFDVFVFLLFKDLSCCCVSSILYLMSHGWYPCFKGDMCSF